MMSFLWALITVVVMVVGRIRGIPDTTVLITCLLCIIISVLFDIRDQLRRLPEELNDDHIRKS